MIKPSKVIALSSAAIFAGLFAASSVVFTSPAFAFGSVCTQEGLLNVTVVDQNNFPLGDVSVSAVQQLEEGDKGADTGSGTTDETGRVDITNLELYGTNDDCVPTTYEVTASKTGCGSKTVLTAIIDDESVPSNQMLPQEVDIQLTCSTNTPSPSVTPSPSPSNSPSPTATPSPSPSPSSSFYPY